jgi:hypothetical protein
MRASQGARKEKAMSVTLTLALLLVAAPTPSSDAAVGHYRFPARVTSHPADE